MPASPQPSTEVKTKWCTVKDVADVCEVDERTVRRWCQGGDVVAELLPGGKNWRVKCRSSDGYPVRA